MSQEGIVRKIVADELVAEQSDAEFLADVLDGLGHAQKQLPCKYFYDERGSQLFSAICETEEYYVTRTELQIMRQSVADMAALVGPDASILEFGSGAGIKIRLLLDALESPDSYAPVDISQEILEQSAVELNEQFPDIAIEPICADYTKQLPQPKRFCAADPARRLVYFPGSTLSNFDRPDAERFLARISAMLGSGGGLLVGVDLVKHHDIFHAAYNDANGVTAAFNKNLLQRINSELEADFRLDQFEHRALYNKTLERIEMYLVSNTEQRVAIAGREFSFENEERLHTENSYKYSVDGLQAMAASAGFESCGCWVDENELFSVHYLRSR